ncbi:hypothetical protein HFN87_26150 [Rhizobium laguerreae]|uniref:hypothetical protein n=1 Tax=Rhizobium laguerreae TaxID=1076926 RepID=UPI001C90E3E3|nr:hypothetical protein [Rhizobium laguerreae]MBY3416753.1 hypothetical protein [Rhizobium laguerreae]
MILKSIVVIASVLCCSTPLYAGDGDFKAKTAVDIANYKKYVGLMGTQIAWLRECDQMPFDKEAGLAAFFINNLPEQESLKVIGQEVFVKASTETQDCSFKPMKKVIMVGFYSAMIILDEFRKTGGWKSVEIKNGVPTITP